jgi:hypothetical protein
VLFGIASIKLYKQEKNVARMLDPQEPTDKQDVNWAPYSQAAWSHCRTSRLWRQGLLAANLRAQTSERACFLIKELVIDLARRKKVLLSLLLLLCSVCA